MWRDFTPRNKKIVVIVQLEIIFVRNLSVFLEQNVKKEELTNPI